MGGPDNRMLWIRNLEGTAPGGRSHVVEAELGAELQIPGLLDYADGAVLCGAATFSPDTTGLYKYCLRLRVPWSAEEGDESKEPLARGTRKGYLFREGPVGELVALFSLCLQVRLFVLSTSPRGLSHRDLPIKTEFAPRRARIDRHVDPILFAQSDRNMCTSLGPFLDQIRSLPSKDHLDIAIAANHYARALREIGIDEEMVFIRLVSAIERVASEQPIPDDPLNSRRIEEFVRVDTLTGAQVDELRAMLQTRRTKSRFIAFLVEHSTGFFDSEPREPTHTQVTPENLVAVAAAVYKARSAYLHNGDPMYFSRMTQFPDWHMDPSFGMIEQDRSYTVEQKLPRADFFHRLVRHCLLMRIRKLTKAGAG